MNNKKRLLIILVVIYFVVTLGMDIYNKNQKYLIFDNDYAYKVSKNKITAVSKYPNIFNDHEINYFDNGKKNIGYIRMNDSKKLTYYNSKYNKMKVDYNTMSSVNIKDLKVYYISDNIIDSDDLDIIDEYLEELEIEPEDNYKFIKKITVEINNDTKSKEYLYIVSNHYLEEDLMTSYMKTDSNAFEVAFVYDNEDYYSLFEREGKETDYYSVLTNIFDYNNDNIYEISFMDYSISDHYHFCSQFYTFDGNNFSNIENCNYIIDEVK